MGRLSNMSEVTCILSYWDSYICEEIRHNFLIETSTLYTPREWGLYLCKRLIRVCGQDEVRRRSIVGRKFIVK